MGKRKRRYSDSDDDELLHQLRRRLEKRSKRKRKHQDDYEYNRYDSDYQYEPEYEDGPCPESEGVFGSDSDERSIRSVVSVPRPSPHTSADKQQTNPDVTTPAQDEATPGASSAPLEVPKDILDLLGESKEKEEVFGPKIQEEVSKRWGKIIMEGLSKDQKQKVMEGVLIPENFQLLKAPKLNPELNSTVLSESARNRDKRLERSQNHLGLGIAAITNLMTRLINGNMEKQEIIKKLSEAGQLLLDLHNQESITRRKLISYSLDKKFLNIARDAKRDSFLFGVDLGERIKAAQTAEKSGLQIKRRFEPQPSTSAYRPNPSASRQGNSTRGLPRHYPQRGRAGGPRTAVPAHQPRRYQPPADRYSSTAKPNNKPSATQARKTP